MNIRNFIFSQLPDEENRDGPPNIHLLAVPDAAASQRTFIEFGCHERFKLCITHWCNSLQSILTLLYFHCTKTQTLKVWTQTISY